MRWYAIFSGLVVVMLLLAAAAGAQLPGAQAALTGFYAALAVTVVVYDRWGSVREDDERADVD